LHHVLANSPLCGHLIVLKLSDLFSKTYGISTNKTGASFLNIEETSTAQASIEKVEIERGCFR
jgi:hypothetical protein